MKPALSLGLLIGGFSVLAALPASAQASAEPSGPAAASIVGDPSPADSARIRVLEGSLQVVRSDGETVDQGTINLPIFPGDVVATADASRTEIQLPGGPLLRLDRRTRLVVLALPDASAEAATETVLQLVEGTLQIELRQAPARDVDFRVDTPAASVYVLAAGRYRLDVEGSGGKLRASSFRGVAEVVGDEGSAILRSGQRTWVTRGAEPETARPFNTAAEDPFDTWVEERNAFYVASPEGHDEPIDEEQIPEPVRPYRAELSQYGDWVTIEPYGLAWTPTGVPAGWRPYWDGYWSWSPYGSFWVSYDPWGWAPYHYGRWVWGGGYGWAWVPGWSFGGAWVSWYYGPGYIGWSPLDYWNYPCSYGYYYGIDYNCWNFVPYHHYYHQHPRRVYADPRHVRIEVTKQWNVVTTRQLPIPPSSVRNARGAPPDLLRTAREIPTAQRVDLSKPAAARRSFQQQDRAYRTVSSARSAGRTDRNGVATARSATSGGQSRGAGGSVVAPGTRTRVEGLPARPGAASAAERLPVRPRAEQGPEAGRRAAPPSAPKPRAQGGSATGPQAGAATQRRIDRPGIDSTGQAPRREAPSAQGATPARPSSRSTTIQARPRSSTAVQRPPTSGSARGTRPSDPVDEIVIPSRQSRESGQGSDRSLREFFRASEPQGAQQGQPQTNRGPSGTGSGRTSRGEAARSAPSGPSGGGGSSSRAHGNSSSGNRSGGSGSSAGRSSGSGGGRSSGGGRPSGGSGRSGGGSSGGGHGGGGRGGGGGKADRK